MTEHSDETAEVYVGPGSWNYRVLHRTVDSGVPGIEPVEIWTLIEAYYDPEGNLVAWADAGPMETDISLDDLVGEAQMRYDAVLQSQMRTPNRRVLTEADLNGEASDGR